MADSCSMSLDSVSKCFKRVYRSWEAGLGPCGRCPIRGPSPSFGIGSWVSKIVFVGQSPNEQRKEGCTYAPDRSDFRGFEKDMREGSWNRSEGPRKGGEYDYADIFDEMLSILKMTKRDVYYTNAVKCSCRKIAHRTDDALIHCYPYLSQELTADKPRLVVAFGAHASSAVRKFYYEDSPLLPLPPILKLHGRVCECSDRKTVVLNLIHWGKRHINMKRVSRDRGKDYELSVRIRFREACKLAGFL